MKQDYWTYNKPLSMTGLGGGAASLSVAGAGGATDLASFFGVDSSTSTTLRIELLDDRYSCDYTQPANGWSDFPISSVGSTGTYLAMVGITATDNIGLWNGGNRYGYSYGTYGYPTDTVICSSVSAKGAAFGNPLSDINTWLTSNLVGYNIPNVTHGTYYAGNYVANTTSAANVYVDCVFSNGLGSALGIVITHYSGYANLLAYNHNPLIRVTCNNISACFVPKGDYVYNANTADTNGQATDAGACYYPTLYDPTTETAVDALFGSLTGNTVPSNYFVY